jgi:hypothetical protein
VAIGYGCGIVLAVTAVFVDWRLKHREGKLTIDTIMLAIALIGIVMWVIVLLSR